MKGQELGTAVTKNRRLSGAGLCCTLVAAADGLSVQPASEAQPQDWKSFKWRHAGMLDGYPLAQHAVIAYFLNRLWCKSGAALQNDQPTRTSEPNIMFDREKLEFCLKLIANEGDAKIGYDPRTIATYLRLQASSAFREKDYKTSACLGAAAMAINEDARNNHTPDWKRAQIYMARAFE